MGAQGMMSQAMRGGYDSDVEGGPAGGDPYNNAMGSSFGDKAVRTSYLGPF